MPSPFLTSYSHLKKHVQSRHVITNRPTGWYLFWLIIINSHSFQELSTIGTTTLDQLNPGWTRLTTGKHHTSFIFKSNPYSYFFILCIVLVIPTFLLLFLTYYISCSLAHKCLSPHLVFDIIGRYIDINYTNPVDSTNHGLSMSPNTDTHTHTYTNDRTAH